MNVEVIRDEKVTDIDGKIVGTRDELIKYVRRELCRECIDLTIDEENRARIMEESASVFQKLVYDYSGNNMLLCLCENPMGSWDVKEIEL